jgi:heme oxygenase
MSAQGEEVRSLNMMEQLRSATHALHEQLDGRMSSHIFVDSFGCEEYRRLLEKFYGFYQPLEQQFDAVARNEAWNEVGLDMSERKRTAQLEADLLSLGATEEEIKRLPLYQGFERILSTVPQMLGALYVAEGSTLGGQFIAHRLEKTLGINSQNGSAFFRSYGPHAVKSMWRLFCERVNSYAEHHPEARGEILDTANAMFREFEHWILA